MRKRLKMKRHSCALCKPNKMGGACRWKPKEEAALKAFEKEKLDVVARRVVNEYGGALDQLSAR